MSTHQRDEGWAAGAAGADAAGGAGPFVLELRFFTAEAAGRFFIEAAGFFIAGFFFEAADVLRWLFTSMVKSTS